MACTVVNMDNSACPVVGGGILESAVAPCTAITDVVFGENGVVTAITYTAGAFKKFKYDRDDTAYYNQEGDRPSQYLHLSNQNAFMKFAGIDPAKVDGARKLHHCCCVVAVHKMANGFTLIQGIELVPGSTTEWQFTKKDTVAKVNIMTDTGSNEDRVEITLTGQAYDESPLSNVKVEDLYV